MKYRILTGKHWIDGKPNPTGSIVDIAEEVADSFPGRFEKVVGKPGRPPKGAKGEDDAPPAESDDKE
jgi:hypothetical protein